jgi:sugar-specific transcriptional regulator TrmB
MQTMVPPEDALAERFARIDERFDRTDERFSDVNRRFDEVNRRITEGREETKERFNRVEGDIAALKRGWIRCNRP